MKPWYRTTTYSAWTPEDCAIVFDHTGAMHEASSIVHTEDGQIHVMGRPVKDGQAYGDPTRINMTPDDALDLLARAEGEPRDKRFDNPEGSAQ